MEWLAIIPLIIALLLIFSIFFIGFTSKGRNRVMQGMMKSNMDALKDMTTGEMGDTLKDLTKTTIKVKKDILKENEDALKEIADMEANIEAGAIKKKASALKEGFASNSTMFCKYCGTNIPSDSNFCMKCGKEQ